METKTTTKDKERNPTVFFTEEVDDLIKSLRSQEPPCSYEEISRRISEDPQNPKFSSKQVRHRYVNNLDPNLCKNDFTYEERSFIIQWVKDNGNKWKELQSVIKNKSGELYAENKLKNFFYSKKRSRSLDDYPPSENKLDIINSNKRSRSLDDYPPSRNMSDNLIIINSNERSRSLVPSRNMPDNSNERSRSLVSSENKSDNLTVINSNERSRSLVPSRNMSDNSNERSRSLVPSRNKSDNLIVINSNERSRSLVPSRNMSDNLIVINSNERSRSPVSSDNKLLLPPIFLPKLLHPVHKPVLPTLPIRIP